MSPTEGERQEEQAVGFTTECPEPRHDEHHCNATPADAMPERDLARWQQDKPDAQIDSLRIARSHWRYR